MAAIVKPNQKAIDALPRPVSGESPVVYGIEGHRFHWLWRGVNGDSYGYRLTLSNQRTCKIVCRDIGVKEAIPLVEAAIREKRQGKQISKGRLIVEATDQQFVVPEIKAHLKDVKGALSRLRVLHNLKLPNGQRLGDTDYRTHDRGTAKAVMYAAKEGRSNATAVRVFRRLSKNHTILVDCELLEINPCIGVKTLPERNIRTKTLSDTEFSLHCQLALEMGTPQSLATVFAGSVGGRIGEAIALRWDMLPPDGDSFVIPDPKNGRPTRVQLNSVAKGILDRCRAFAINEWVFPSFRNEGEHIARPRESFEKIRTEVFNRLYGSDPACWPSPYLQHDFRRSYASKLCCLTGDLRLTQIALNHKSSSTTERYTHYLPTEMADASERTVQALFGDLFTTTNP
tara:strand:- start:2413 stop:3609 length:1197 start_codon:yes stop_codon:yes gene_type:complete